MATRAIRRRLHRADIDGMKNETMDSPGFDALDEPLLQNYSYDESHSEANGRRNQQEIWDDKKKESLHWTFLFSNVIAQWAQWLASVVFSTGSLLGRLLPLSSRYNGQRNWNHQVYLSPLQEERLQNLKRRLGVPFDDSRLEHQDALRQLWKLAYPYREIPPLKSELWKEMGWQGSDPSTDFRGGGYISLENLIFFARNYPSSFQMLLHKQIGMRAEWEYPFAVAGVNISFMLVQMLDLQSGIPSTKVGIRFLELLGEDERAFDSLFCVAFMMMDAQWLARRASYMEFNEVLKSARTQLERELSLEDVSSVKDLPAYTMLNR